MGKGMTDRQTDRQKHNQPGYSPLSPLSSPPNMVPLPYFCLVSSRSILFRGACCFVVGAVFSGVSIKRIGNIMCQFKSVNGSISAQANKYILIR